MGIGYRSVLGGGGATGVPIDSFEITTLPSKLTYEVGDSLDTTGMVVTATADGMSGNVASRCSFAPTTFDSLGAHAVTCNYHGAQDAFTILVTEGTIGTLEETSWSLIKSVGSTGLGDQYWAVGDTKSVSVSGTVGNQEIEGDWKVFIIDFNYQGDNGIYFQCFSYGNNYLGLHPTNTSSSDGRKNYNWNHWQTDNACHGGWKGCDLRYDVLGSTDVPPSGYGAATTSGRVGYDATSTCATNPVQGTLMAALPGDLRTAIAPWTIYSDNVGAKAKNVAANVTASIDYLPLLSEYEVKGTRTYANSAEQNYQSQMAFYANGGTLVKYRHTAPTQYTGDWESRSFDVNWGNTEGSYVYFAKASGYSPAHSSGGSMASLLCPAFRVA